MSDQNQDPIRQNWKTGSKIQIFSGSKKDWFVGDIISIIHDEEGEWLEIKYDKYSKQVQRYSTDIKPIDDENAATTTAITTTTATATTTTTTLSLSHQLCPLYLLTSLHSFLL